MSLHDELTEVIEGFPVGPATTAEIVAAVQGALLKADWHGPTDCAEPPECNAPHCPNPEAHDADLMVAVHDLHAQAHNAPTDTLTATRCHREPCRSVA